MIKNLLRCFKQMAMQSSIKFGIVLASLMVVSVACGNDNSDHAQQSSLPESLQPLHKEILQIHDEVMPEMNQISKLQNRLSNQLDTLRKQEPVDKNLLKETNRMLGELNRAENAMWSWMHGFSKLDSIPDDHKEKFLKAEKSSAQSMRDLMLHSIEDAKEYLDTNTKSSGEG